MNKFAKKISIAFLLSCIIFFTGCADSIVKTSDTAQNVNDFYTLLSAVESSESITISLDNDIIATEDLKILSPSNQKREITLNLNGHSLFFENEKSLFVDEENVVVEGEIIKPQVNFTLTSGKNGGSVVFKYEPEGCPGGIINNGKFTLDGGVIITAANKVTGDVSLETLLGDALVWTNFQEGCVFTMNSGMLNALGNYKYAVECFGGQVIINSGIVKNEGERSIAISNWGGKLNINGGEIQATGDECVAISNEDTFEPLVNPDGNSAKTSTNSDNFIIAGGKISANGNNSIAIAAERNCAIADGTISANGKDSVGILYNYVGIGGDLQINIIKGQIKGEGHALIDYRGNSAFYKNKKDKIVNVGSDVKEIIL